MFHPFGMPEPFILLQFILAESIIYRIPKGLSFRGKLTFLLRGNIKQPLDIVGVEITHGFYLLMRTYKTLGNHSFI